MLPTLIATLSAALAQEAVVVQHEPLNTLGWTFMLVSVSFVTILTVWCFHRVLTAHVQPPQPVQDFHSA